MADSKFGVSVVVGAVDNVSFKLMQINEKINKMTAPVGRLQSAFGLLSKESGLSGLGSSLANVGQKGGALFSALGTSALRFASIAGAAGLGFGLFVKSTNESIDAIKDASDRIGISTTKFQELRFAASQTGLDLNKLEPVLTKFSKNIGDAALGTGEAKDVFKAMGIDVKKAGGDMSKILPQVADKLKSINDPTVKLAIAQRLFGKEGAKMLPMLEGGAEGLKKFGDAAKANGFILDEAAIKKNAEFNDTLAKLGLQFENIKSSILVELLPVLQQLANEFFSFVQENRPQIIAFAKAFAENLPGIITDLKDLFSGLWSAVQPIIFAFKVLSGIFGTANVAMAGLVGYIAGPAFISFLSFTGALAGLQKEMLKIGVKIIPFLMTGLKSLFGLIVANPIVATIVGIAALGVILYKNWEPFRNLIDSIWEGITSIGSAAAKFFGFGGAEEPGAAGASASGGPSGAPAGGLAIGRAAQNFSSSKNSSEVTINFENAPKGTRISETKSEVPTNLNMGYSMAGL